MYSAYNLIITSAVDGLAGVILFYLLITMYIGKRPAFLGVPSARPARRGHAKNRALSLYLILAMKCAQKLRGSANKKINR